VRLSLETLALLCRTGSEDARKALLTTIEIYKPSALGARRGERWRRETQDLTTWVWCEAGEIDTTCAI
jgi:hypothetical protein